jgi:hypothetical protein
LARHLSKATPNNREKKFEQLPGNNLEPLPVPGNNFEELPGNNLPLVQGGETDSLQQLEQVVHVLRLLKDGPNQTQISHFFFFTDGPNLHRS